MNTIDQGRAVRNGEEFDVAAVERWLRGQGITLEGEVELSQFGGGASNWTYRLEYANRDLILRRPPAGTKAKSAHDMQREFRVQSALRPVYPVVPEMVALCTDESVIGCDFYLMDRIEGIIPRANLPRALDLSEAQVRALCENAVDQLAALHEVDYRAVGLESLGKGEGYSRRQVEGWSARYLKAKSWNVPGFRRVRDWLHHHTPDDVRTCVIHNDWRFDNLVLDPADPTRIIGVLDWEMATLGDPLMDLGCALAYWVQADDDRFMRSTRRQPTHLPGMLTRDQVVERYLKRSGLSCDNWRFYEVFGLFRLAVIIQQIYYRYHHGQTRNPAFKRFWLLVHYFDRRCRRLIT